MVKVGLDMCLPLEMIYQTKIELHLVLLPLQIVWLTKVIERMKALSKKKYP